MTTTELILSIISLVIVFISLSLQIYELSRAYLFVEYCPLSVKSGWIKIENRGKCNATDIQCKIIDNDLAKIDGNNFISFNSVNKFGEGIVFKIKNNSNSNKVNLSIKWKDKTGYHSKISTIIFF